jgi:hypothetical protein
MSRARINPTLYDVGVGADMLRKETVVKFVAGWIDFETQTD